MITTTLNRIREHSPSPYGWTKLLNGLGKTKADDEPLPFATILEINGLDDALWCCRVEPQYAKEWRLLSVAFARRVEHLNTDLRFRAAIYVSERYANDTEWTASGAIAQSAVREAARSAAAAWGAATDAERGTASAASWDAEREWQKQEFLRVVTETE